MARKTEQAMIPLRQKVLDMHLRGEKRIVMALETGLTMSGLYHHIRTMNLQRPISSAQRRAGN